MAARARARGWHREDIAAALRKQHGRLTHLSVAWGYARGSLSAALSDPRGYPRLCRRIAEALQQQPHTLWPDHWTSEGVPQPRTVSDRNASRAGSRPHRQKEAAA